MTHGDRYLERRRGLAVTELALVLPLSFVLFIGILDFGRVYYSAIAVSHAARAGVQYGAQDNVKSGDFAGMRQAASDALGDVSNFTVTACRYCQCADGTGSCTSCNAGTDGCSTGSGCLGRAAGLRPGDRRQGLHDALPLSGAPQQGRPQSKSDHAGAMR